MSENPKEAVGVGRGGRSSFIRQEAFIVITVNDLMAPISLLWNTNIAAVTPCENALVNIA